MLIWMATRGASCLFKVDIAEMKDARHHSEEIELLCVIQADFLHGRHHPVEVSQVIQQRVLQSTHFPVLRTQRTIKTHGSRINNNYRSHTPQVPQKDTQWHCSWNQRSETHTEGLYTDLDLWLKGGKENKPHLRIRVCQNFSFFILYFKKKRLFCHNLFTLMSF